MEGGREEGQGLPRVIKRLPNVEGHHYFLQGSIPLSACSPILLMLHTHKRGEGGREGRGKRQSYLGL